MGKKKDSSASRRKQPPPSTPIDQPSQPPPTPDVQSVDPEIKRHITRVVRAWKTGGHNKALDFIKESISYFPLSGYLYHVEGVIHQDLACNAGDDYGAKVKHLADGVFSSQLAVELLPNSIYCASLLVDFLSCLAFFSQEWDRVIEVCKQALKIEHCTDVGQGEIFGLIDELDESKIEAEKQHIVMCLKAAEQRKNRELSLKNVLEAVELEDKEREVSVVDINYEVVAMDRRKMQFKAIARVCGALQQKMIDNNKKKSDGDDEKIVEYKQFWSSSLTIEIKRGFKKVNLEELKKYLKSLKCQLAVDHLTEATDFARKKKTLKFWECYDCVKKFDDYAQFKCHFWNMHWKDTALKLKTDLYIDHKSVNMVVDCVWKPVDNAKVTKIIVNHIKSESCSNSDSELGIKKDLDECESSSAREIPGRISESGNNESSKTSVDDPKWTFCDDIERAEILVRIKGMFELLLKNNFLASSHVCWVKEYTKDQFESTIPLSQFRDHGLETLQIICCLSASQLKEVHEFLIDVAIICGLREDADINSSVNRLCGDLFDVRIDFNKDYSCLLWQELQGEPDDANNFYAVSEDGSALVLALKGKEEVLYSKYDVVSWLHLGANCEEALESWTCLRDFQRIQAMKFLKMLDEELLLVSKLHGRHIEISSMLTAVQVVGSVVVKEMMKMEKCPGEKTQHFLDLLKKRRKEIEETDYISVSTELEVMCNVVEDAIAISCDQSGSEQCSKEDQWKGKDNAVKIALRRLKLQLLKDLSLVDAIVLGSIGAIKQYEVELASISVYDYRSIIVPMLKSFLKLRLKNLYEDAKEKSKAAEEALLALEEAEKKINKDSDSVRQKQDKKKRKKKNKNPKKAKESEGTHDSKQFELYQEGAEQDHNPAQNDESLDELEQFTVHDEEQKLAENDHEENEKRFLSDIEKAIHLSLEQLTVNDEERKLAEHLENQRRFEEEASLIVNMSRSIVVDEPQKKAKDAGEDFQPRQKNDDKPHAELGDSERIDESQNFSAIEDGMPEEYLEYQVQIETQAKQKCIAEKPDNMGENIVGNVTESVSDISSKRNHEEYEKRFQADIEKAISLSLDCYEKCYGSLSPTDVNDGKTSRLDVQLYVIVQSQWYLRQIRDEFMSRPDENHTHAGDPCFHCAYKDTFAARLIASRDWPEEDVQPSSKKLYPVDDFFQEWLNIENQVNKVIHISPSANQLKQQLVDVVTKIVLALEDERQIKNKA